MSEEFIVEVGDMRVGVARAVKASAKFSESIVCCLSGDTPPYGGLEIGEGRQVVAFSRQCTHLGCRLAPTLEGESPGVVLVGNLLRCSCHSSCFDLTARGLVANGPATACLPQLEIEAVDHPLTKIRLVGWLRNASVPYGVAYEEQSEA